MSNLKELQAMADALGEVKNLATPTVYKHVSAGDRQEGGSHYKNMAVQPWDVIDGSFSEQEREGYYRGNALKYILRNGAKGKPQEDIRKAIHYLEKLVEVLTEEGK